MASHLYSNLKHWKSKNRNRYKQTRMHLCVSLAAINELKRDLPTDTNINAQLLKQKHIHRKFRATNATKQTTELLPSTLIFRCGRSTNNSPLTTLAHRCKRRPPAGGHHPFRHTHSSLASRFKLATLMHGIANHDSSVYCCATTHQPKLSTLFEIRCICRKARAKKRVIIKPKKSVQQPTRQHARLLLHISSTKVPVSCLERLFA